MRRFATACFAILLISAAAFGQDSLNVSLQSQVVFWEFLGDNVYAGNRVYAPAGTEGIFIFDVSDPANPVIIGYCDTPGAAEQAVVSGNYLYVADHQAGLCILDMSNPADPVCIGQCDTPGESYGLAYRDGYVYLGDGYQGFKIIDVSDPVNPTITASLPLISLGMGYAVAVSGNYAYITYYECGCGWGGRIFVADISDPLAPFLVDTLGTGNASNNIEVSGNLLISAGQPFGLFIYDLTVPAHPNPVYSPWQAPIMANDACVSGTDLFYTDGMQVHSLDISDPSNPQPLDSIQADAWGISVANSRAYLTGYEGFKVLDVSDPQNMISLSSLNRTGRNFEVALKDSYALVGNDSLGLCVFNVASPQHAAFVTNLPVGDEPRGFAVEGNYAYITRCEGNLAIIDVTGPQTPSLVSQTFIMDNLWGLCVHDGYAYLTSTLSYVGRLLIVDVSDPANPVTISQTVLQEYPLEVTVVDHYAYVAVSNYGLTILDIQNPSAPAILGNFPLNGTLDVAVANGIAYMAVYDEGIYAINVADPSNPTLLDSLSLAGDASDVECALNHVFVANYYDGLYVLDATDPSAMEVSGYYHLNGDACGVAVSGSYSYVAAGHYFAVLDHSAALAANPWEQPHTAPSTFALHSCHPNPFNSSTALSYELRAASQVKLTVWDTAGRLVATLVNERHAAGVHQATFDGSRLASGIYLARLEAGEFTATQKLALLK